ncbi:hypothetical protein [Pelomonas sp. Root1444]|uniref:hypothetical protein n=1 Tax=Pelomonas sp. Root1444 TaxID=1736464 RepID=UPI0007027F4B|nr:hypothetical protein [Pelomonas sp. Root1444]KQY86832.1 hypothetical protein ASD35_18825 [Pelomonas sp. Root1444]
MKPLLLTLALAAALPAFAQTQVHRAQVYRCGPDGRDLRDSPCPGGAQPASVDFDQPSTADSRAARDRHLADAKQAAALAAARRASEAEARRQKASHIGLQAAAPAQAASSPQVTYLKPPKTAKPKRPSGTGSSAGR